MTKNFPDSTLNTKEISLPPPLLDPNVLSDRSGASPPLQFPFIELLLLALNLVTAPLLGSPLPPRLRPFLPFSHPPPSFPPLLPFLSRLTPTRRVEFWPFFNLLISIPPPAFMALVTHRVSTIVFQNTIFVCIITSAPYIMRYFLRIEPSETRAF